MAWVRYDDKFYSNSKVTAAIHEDPAALALHVLANTWTNGQKLPGYVPAHQPGLLVCDRQLGAQWAGVLVRSGLWHERGSECKECAEEYAHLPEGSPGFVFHNAKEYRAPARDRVTPGTPADLSEKRRAAGRRGGKASAAKRSQNGQDAGANEAKPVSKTSNLLVAGVSPEPVPVPEPVLPLPAEGGSPAAVAAPADDSLFAVQPSARAPKPRRPAAAETTGNAGDVVAAFIEGAKERNRTVPPPIIKQVGATAKQLIQAGTVPHDQLVNAAREMGRKGWKDLNMQLFRGSEAPNGGGYVAQRVNTDKPGSHTEAWNRRRAQHAHQQ